MPAWTSSSFAVDYISNRQKELLCAVVGLVWYALRPANERELGISWWFSFFSIPHIAISSSLTPVEFHFYNMQSSYSSKIYFSDLLNEIKATYWWFLDVFYCIINNNISDFCVVWVIELAERWSDSDTRCCDEYIRIKMKKEREEGKCRRGMKSRNIKANYYSSLLFFFPIRRRPSAASWYALHHQHQQHRAYILLDRPISKVKFLIVVVIGPIMNSLKKSWDDQSVFMIVHHNVLIDEISEKIFGVTMRQWKEATSPSSHICMTCTALIR